MALTQPCTKQPSHRGWSMSTWQNLLRFNGKALGQTASGKQGREGRRDHRNLIIVIICKLACFILPNGVWNGRHTIPLISIAFGLSGITSVPRACISGQCEQQQWSVLGLGETMGWGEAFPAQHPWVSLSLISLHLSQGLDSIPLRRAFSASEAVRMPEIITG